MILRKPYAFLIKHFKLIHLVMFLLMGILVYQTNILLTFFNDFIASSQNILGTEVIDVLIGGYIYIFPVLITLISIVVFVLMSFKEKPRLYYALNIIGYILLIALYVYASSTIYTMQTELVDERVIRAIRDFLNIIFVFQLYSIFVAVIRSIGLDVKKFDFSQDAQDLNITDKDNEEFEVNVEFDSQTLRRNVKHNIRNLKYYFIENKFFLLAILGILLFSGGLTLYLNLRDKTVKYSMNQAFSPMNYNLVIENAYSTSNNLRLQEVVDEDNSLVVVKFKIKTLNKTEKFIYGKLSLKIGDNKYYHTTNYTSSLTDLGNSYISQVLNNEYQGFLLVYKIPSSLKNESMDLVYTEQIVQGMFRTTTDDKKIPLSITDLDEKKDQVNINRGQNYIIGDGLLSEYELKLNNYEMANSFKIDYNVCVKSNECYSYYEFLQPSISGISDKSLLKLNMDIVVPENGNIKDLATLITKFGVIEYQDDGKTKSANITKVLNTIHNDGNNYFEINRDVMKADQISLVINARNNKYVFKLK